MIKPEGATRRAWRSPWARRAHLIAESWPRIRLSPSTPQKRPLDTLRGMPKNTESVISLSKSRNVGVSENMTLAGDTIAMSMHGWRMDRVCS
jgi:hypothetical protein